MSATATATRKQIRKSLGADAFSVIKALSASNEALANNLQVLLTQVADLHAQNQQLAANQINLNERLQTLEGAKPLVSLH